MFVTIVEHSDAISALLKNPHVTSIPRQWLKPVKMKSSLLNNSKGLKSPPSINKHLIRNFQGQRIRKWARAEAKAKTKVSVLKIKSNKMNYHRAKGWKFMTVQRTMSVIKGSVIQSKNTSKIQKPIPEQCQILPSDFSMKNRAYNLMGEKIHQAIMVSFIMITSKLIMFSHIATIKIPKNIRHIRVL